MMKYFYAFILSTILSFAGGHVIVNYANASGLGGSSGVGGSSFNPNRACETGYTRKESNYCAKDTTTSGGLTTGTCYTFTAPSVNLKTWVFHLGVSARSSNAVGARQSYTQIFSDSLCTTALAYIVKADAYEHVAVVADTILSTDHATTLYSPPTKGGSLYLKNTATPATTGSFIIIGYYD